PRPDPMAMVRQPLLFARLPLGTRRVLFGLVLFGTCLLFAFPVLWLILTSLRPISGVYYVHRGTEFTLGNFAEVLQDERVVEAFANSAVIATLATVFSLLVTVSSGYMLSRFQGVVSRTWFGTIYVFRCVPYISWVLGVLCWLFTWNEFLFALILTGNRVPVITVVMAQFVTEMGLRWNLMAATAVMALLPAFLLALFGQKYVIRGLRV